MFRASFGLIHRRTVTENMRKLFSLMNSEGWSATVFGGWLVLQIWPLCAEYHITVFCDKTAAHCNYVPESPVAPISHVMSAMYRRRFVMTASYCPECVPYWWVF